MNKLPEGWQEVVLKEVVIPRKESGKIDQDNYIEIGDINIDNKKYKLKEKKSIKGCKLAKKNDIIISRVRPTRGAVSIINNDLIEVSSAFSILISKNNILPKYLFYYIAYNINFYDYLEKLQKGSSYPSCRESDILSYKISLPSLFVQQKIVELLEKAEKTKELRKETNNLSDEYLKSVFNEMFGDKDKFINKNIGEVCNVLSGSTPSTKKEEYWNGNIDWVTPAELEDGDNYYYFLSKRKITKAGLDSASTLFPKNTVMLTTRAPIGKVAIAGKEMCTNQGFKNMICKKELNHIYMYCWLLFNKKYLNFLGVGATFKEISKRIVEKIKIPIPPLELQEKFARIVEKVEEIKRKQEESSLETENLFYALMQKAFKGELNDK
jgi:type I restriction enzyme, S subunit